MAAETINLYPVAGPHGVIHVARHELRAAQRKALEEARDQLGTTLDKSLFQLLSLCAARPAVPLGLASITLAGFALRDLCEPPKKRRPRRAARGRQR